MGADSRLVLIAGTSFSLIAAAAGGREYTFTKVADSRFIPSSAVTLGAEDINDHGEVAVYIEEEDNGIETIAYGSGGPLNVIFSTFISDVTGIGPVTFNNARQTAFPALIEQEQTREVIFRIGDQREIVADNSGPIDSFAWGPHMNNKGQIAVQGYLDNFDAALFLIEPDGALRTIFDTSSSQFDQSYGLPSINDAGHIAFEAGLKDGRSGLFLFRDGEFTTLVNDGDRVRDRFVSFASDPVLNEKDQVLFEALLGEEDDGSGFGALLLSENGELRTVVQTEDGPFSFVNGFDMNDSGQIVFQGELRNEDFGDAPRQAIFVGPDPIADRILAAGDILDGQVVTSLGIGAINELGQIALRANLADGRVTVYLATPVPEPGAGVALLGVAMTIACRRRRA